MYGHSNSLGHYTWQDPIHSHIGPYRLHSSGFGASSMTAYNKKAYLATAMTYVALSACPKLLPPSHFILLLSTWLQPAQYRDWFSAITCLIVLFISIFCSHVVVSFHTYKEKRYTLYMVEATHPRRMGPHFIIKQKNPDNKSLAECGRGALNFPQL